MERDDAVGSQPDVGGEGEVVSLGDERRERLARNEAVFREVNEQIDSLNDLGAGLRSFGIVCECGAESCVETITIEKSVYEAVRAHPERFIVLPGHVAPDVDAPLEEHDGFVVVAKNPGAPRETAEATDPRGPSGDNPSPVDAAEIDGEMARRLGENESRFRDANEQIGGAVERLEPEARTVPFVCECGRPDCLETIRITFEEYALARRDTRYFLCSPGHEIVGSGLGRVVEQRSKFVIVEKLGVAGEIAEQRAASPTRERRTGTA